MVKEFKSALLGPCNSDTWFKLLNVTKADAATTSYEAILDIYSDIFRDLHNDSIPIVVKIHMLAYLEENSLKLTPTDCFELVYCPLLLIFENQFNPSSSTRSSNIKGRSTTTPISNKRTASSTQFNRKATNLQSTQNQNETLYFHKMATCLTSLILLSIPNRLDPTTIELLNSTNVLFDTEPIEKFIDLLLGVSVKPFIASQHNPNGNSFSEKPDSIIVECLHQLNEHTGLVKGSAKFERYLSNYNQRTLFAMLEDIKVFTDDTLDSLARTARELIPQFVHAILRSATSDLLKPQYLDSMIDSKFSIASLKQLVTALSIRKELPIIHIQLVLMFKSGLQLFSGNCEEMLIENLQETSFKTSIDVSSRLLALELLRDLSLRTIRPDLIHFSRLRPSLTDKPDTLEKKYCILCLSNLQSDDEILSIIMDLQHSMTKGNNFRSINAFYRMLSFTISERPGLMESIEEIVYSLAQGSNKLFNHALCLMEAQQALVLRLTSRIIDYIISDFDSLSTTLDSYYVIRVFDWVINRDIHLEESKILVLFTLISGRLIAQPKDCMKFMPLFTSILWNCEMSPLLKAKMNKLFEQLLHMSNDQTSTMWFEFYHTALSTFSETCKIRELDSCQATYSEDEVKDLESSISVQPGLICPINLKRIDHTNYVSFPPTDINLELIFEISLKDDLEHNYTCDKIFAISIELYSEDKKNNLNVDLPILVKGDNKTFKTMFRPISVSPFQIHFNFEFTDKDAKSYKFIDSYSCQIRLQDLLFPVSAEHNHPSRIKFNELWQTIANEQKSIETIIIIPEHDDLDQFFRHHTWLNYYRITGRTGSYSFGDNIEALCVMSKERYLLMRFSITNGCVKIHILTNNYLIINHLFYELKGHTIDS